MDQIHVVRHKVLVEHRPIRAVAREMGLHRKTIRRYLRDPVPRRIEEGPRPRPARDRIEARVAEIVREWASRTTAKQRLSGKHQWLFLHPLDSPATVRRLVAFYVAEHNGRLPHAAFDGQTPDEMYFGTGGHVPAALTIARAEARRHRLEVRRALRGLRLTGTTAPDESCMVRGDVTPGVGPVRPRAGAGALQPSE